MAPMCHQIVARELDEPLATNSTSIRYAAPIHHHIWWSCGLRPRDVVVSLGTCCGFAWYRMCLGPYLDPYRVRFVSAAPAGAPRVTRWRSVLESRLTHPRDGLRLDAGWPRPAGATFTLRFAHLFDSGPLCATQVRLRVTLSVTLSQRPLQDFDGLSLLSPADVAVVLHRRLARRVTE